VPHKKGGDLAVPVAAGRAAMPKTLNQGMYGRRLNRIEAGTILVDFAARGPAHTRLRPCTNVRWITPKTKN
jgi:hypothetical protein